MLYPSTLFLSSTLTLSQSIQSCICVLYYSSYYFLGLHLPWTQYFALIKTILKQLDRQKVEKEKVLLTALCSILDSFHFEFDGDEEAEGMEVPVLALSRRTMKPKNKKISIEEKVEGRMLLEAEDESSNLMLKNTKVDKDGNDLIADDEEFEEEEQEGRNVAVSGTGTGTMKVNSQGEGESKNNDDNDNNDKEGEEENDDEKDDNKSNINNNNNNESNENPVNKSHSIARAVVNSIMPWVKVFLLKEEKDHKGNKSKTVRPMVALALTKLISRLHSPVVSEEKRNTLFTSLVIRVVDTLRSRDSQARDAARSSLSQMVQTMGLSSLKTVIYELQHSLTEGYQRHVCNYTIRFLLTNILTEYSPPDAPSFEVIPVAPMDVECGWGDGDEGGGGADFSNSEAKVAVMPVFDECIPLIVMSVLDDLNGVSVYSGIVCLSIYLSVCLSVLLLLRTSISV